MVQLDPDVVKPPAFRLKRAGRQLSAVVRILKANRECESVVTQIATVPKAIDRTDYSVIAHDMRICLLDDPTGELIDTQKLEKLFPNLS